MAANPSNFTFQVSSNREITLKSEISRGSKSRSIQVRLGTQNRMYLHSRTGTSQIIKSSFLTSLIGFHPGKPNLIVVNYSHRRHPIYHEYKGGRVWIPTVPNEYGSPGMQTSISISILTKRKFIKKLPPFSMKNDSNLPWLAMSVSAECLTKNHGRLCVEFRQEPSVAGVSRFKLEGEVHDPLRFHLGDTSLRFQMTDAVGQKRLLTLYHNGHKAPRLGIKYGHEFYSVKFLSADGVRARLVYKSGTDTFNVATIYLCEPSKLYQLGKVRPFQDSSSKNQDILEVDQVRLMRPLERNMLWHGGTYDAGRIGSEIAYSIGKSKLMLRGLILPDPNNSGRDLYTGDGRVVLQTRMLTQTSFLPTRSLENLIESQISRLVKKLREDFEFNPGAKVGYAIISYLSAAMIRARIVKISP